MPEHVDLLFLPAHVPELQPAEHLWPLTITALANRHVASGEVLADDQLERCSALPQKPGLIRATDPRPPMAEEDPQRTRSQVQFA